MTAKQPTLPARPLEPAQQALKRTSLLRWLGVASLLALTSCTAHVGEASLFPPRYEVLPPMAEGVSRRNLELTMADGVTLRGWYLEKPSSQRTVIFFYGNRSSVVTSAWTLFWFVEALNANVLALDYRGYGFSDGTASLQRFVEDALQIHSYAVESLGRRNLPLIIVGQSMGTASALHVAANRNVDGVVLLAPPGTNDDLVAAMNAQAPWYVSVKAESSLKELRFSPLRDAERVEERTLFVSGNADGVASPDAVARLTSACSAPKKFACRVPGGHGDMRAENPEVRKCIAGFVLDPSQTAPQPPAAGEQAHLTPEATSR